MSAILTQEAVSAQTLEHVLGTGDLSKLTTAQRVEYYRRTCETIGVNPLTRPFRFMSLNGQTVLYATRDLTDQLRQIHKVKISIVDKTIDGDLFVVTARATTPDGRHDEDLGAVTIGHLKGDARANAVMKALTKAKRRVTLSICGLGFSDETELETLAGVQTFDAEDAPPAPIRTVADVPLQPLKRETLREWMTRFEVETTAAQTPEEASRVLDPAMAMEEFLSSRPAARAQYDAIRQACIARVWAEPPEDDDEDAPEIRGEANVLAG